MNAQKQEEKTSREGVGNETFMEYSLPGKSSFS